MERWKRIKDIGDEKHYFEISNQGRVRTCRILATDEEGYCEIEEHGRRYPFSGKVFIKGVTLKRGIAYRDQWFDVSPKYQVNGRGVVRQQKIIKQFNGKIRITHKYKSINRSVKKLMKVYFPHETI